jgi:hypothetical protein
MLITLSNFNDPLAYLCAGDPVRPEISLKERFQDGRSVHVWSIDGIPAAVTCTALMDSVPSSVEQLLAGPVDTITHIIFYTIWSLRTGSAAQLLRAVRSTRPDLDAMTLSPISPSAEKFHLKNGAVVYRRNPFSVNYSYS